jgi:8-oxo-dGTP pyrophosphatase MutT (NUDIX family)
MKQLSLINPRNISHEEASGYKLREAARAIVLDEDKNIALLHVSRDAYYKLPGGGIEDNEDMLIGLQRECQEEIGCDIEVIQELGSTVEYWKEDTEKQISYCFLAKLVGAKGTPALTESEKERGFETVWLPYDEAMNVLKGSKPIHWEGEYIVQREIVFLEEASNYLN